MKLVITGGHLSPALSVIENLPSDIKPYFIGRKHTFEGDKSLSLEYLTISSMSIPFIDIPNSRLQRKFTIYTIPSILKFPYVLIKTIVILKRVKPDVVLGFGGYISFAVSLCSFFLRIPVVIHEQTLEVGLSNKIVSKFAKKVCISWKSSERFFPKKKIVFTGNPVEKELFDDSVLKDELPQLTKLKSLKLPVIYITGGSSGSHFINTLIEENLTELLGKYVLIHQAGASLKFKDFDRLESIRKNLDSNLRDRYSIVKFINPHHFFSVIAASDLVIGRAGINTLTQLILLQKPVLFIPLPFSQNNEQTKNALFMKELGLSEVLSQKKLDKTLFVDKIERMLKKIDSYKIKNTKDVLEKNAEEKIIKVVKDVFKKSKKKK